MKFDLLSRNAIVLVEEILSNQDLLKLVYYGDNQPQDNKDIEHTGALVETTIHTSPFAGDVPETEEVNLRVFFPKGRIRNRVVLGTTISFQIVIHKGLWHIRDKEGIKCLRPYEIMSKIVDQFEDKSIKTLGVIHFTDFYYHHINSAWGVYTLEANMMTL